MKEAERDLLEAIGVSQKQFNKLPNLMVRERGDRLRLMIHSTLEEPVVLGDWVCITVSGKDFIGMATLFQKIVESHKKDEKQEK